MKRTMSLFLILALFLTATVAYGAKAISTFPMTMDEFNRAINGKAQELSAPEWQKGELGKGSVTTSQTYLISRYTGAVVKVPHGSNGISNIITMLTIDKDTPDRELYTFIMTFGAALAVIAPEITPDERGNILRELGLLGKGFPEKQTKVQKNNVICTFAKSTATPTLILTISAAE